MFTPKTYSNRQISKKSVIPLNNNWLGLNRITGAENQGEMTECVNMSSDNIPFASPRQSRELIKEGITAPQVLFSANDKLGYIANGNLSYDKGNGIENIGVVGSTSAVVDFNGNIVMYPSNKVYDYTTGVLSSLTTYTSTPTTGRWLGSNGNHSTDANDFRTSDLLNPGEMLTERASAFELPEISTPNNEVITINSNISEKAATGDYIYAVRLLVVALNASNAVITYNSGGQFYYKYKFGEAINIPGAKKLKISVGFCRKAPHLNYGQGDTSERDAQYARSDLSVWYQMSEYPTAGGVPIIKYATVDNNRIVGVEGNNIYASSQGSYSDWTDFEDENGNPDPLGSYNETLTTPQEITGVIKYGNFNVITKPDYLYEMRGNAPPYTTDETAKTGCIDGRSIVEVNSVLYWLGRKGIYAYTGGQPRLISQKLNKTFTQGVAGTDGRKYYISAFDGAKWELYVFDTQNGLWHKEDNLQAVGFAYCQGYLHALTSDGKLYKFNSGNERVEWEFETQRFTFGIPNVKSIAKLFIRAEMQLNTDLDIYIRSDNGEYERIVNSHADGYTMFDFKYKVKKIDSFQFKFSGIGDVRLLDVHADITVGTTKHRTDISVFRG